MTNPEWIAPPGKLWECMACEKRAKSRDGNPAHGRVDRGWDAACFLNATLVDEEEEHGEEKG